MTARGILCLSLLLSATMFAQQEPGKSSSSKPKHSTAATVAKRADTEAAKVADIRRLLEVTGTRDMVNQMKSGMMAEFRKNAPGISTEMLDEMMAELKAEDLVESMIPVY